MMSEGRVIVAAFLASLVGHSLFLGMPGFKAPAPQRDKQPEEHIIEIVIEKPILLPKIDIIGEEKKLKAVEEEKKPPEPEPRPQLSQALPEESPDETIREKIEADDVAQEEMFRYQDVVKQRIQDARRYPGLAKRHGVEGVVDIGFTVLSNGTLGETAIVSYSGSEILDTEALATVRRAGPFPRFPKQLHKPSLRMRIAIVFSLRQ